MLILKDVLSDAQVQTLREQLEQCPFVDGKATAKGQAASRKNNEQADLSDATTLALSQQVVDALMANPTFQSAAIPRRIMSPMFSRYRDGMEYGFHLDKPFMGQGADMVRADLSLTLFLNAPDSYQGGELVVQTPAGDMTIKLAAGDAVMYFSGTRHRVMPVTAGERLAAVTWIESRVRDGAEREMLHDLALAREQLRARDPGAPELERFDKVYINLLRRWGDG